MFAERNLLAIKGNQIDINNYILQLEYKFIVTFAINIISCLFITQAITFKANPWLRDVRGINVWPDSYELDNRLF